MPSPGFVVTTVRKGTRRKIDLLCKAISKDEGRKCTIAWAVEVAVSNELKKMANRKVKK